METWLTDLLIIVSPGIVTFVVGRFLIEKRIIRLEELYLFLVKLAMGKPGGKTLTLEWCKDAIVHDPATVERIASLNGNLTPQELAGLYVYAVSALLLSADPSISVDYYTKALELDPENPDIWFKRGVSYWRLENWQAQIADYTKAALLYRQQGRIEEAENTTKEASHASFRYQCSLKPTTFQPVSGKIFDSESWQPLGEERVLILTGTRSLETNDFDNHPAQDLSEVILELHWRTYSVPVAVISESDKVGYLGYFLYQGQRLRINEDITYTLAGYRQDSINRYQATDLELFCFNYLIETLRRDNWNAPEESLETLELTWESNRQTWMLSASGRSSGAIYNTTVYSSYEASVAFDLQSFSADYCARYYLDCTD